MITKEYNKCDNYLVDTLQELEEVENEIFNTNYNSKHFYIIKCIENNNTYFYETEQGSDGEWILTEA